MFDTASSLLRRCLALVLLAGAGLCSRSAATEAHASLLCGKLEELRQAVLAERGIPRDKAVFLALWDFDGTLLKGDCTEGLSEQGRVLYPGLAQLAIEAGLSPDYRGPGAFDRFWSDYSRMDERIGHWLAYPFIVQIFRGVGASELESLSRRHFEQVLKTHYFASSIQVLRALEASGVENHVISASAEVFVRGAASTVGLPVERIHGIRVRIDDGGRMTRELLYPLTLGEGKREKLLLLVQEAYVRHPGCQVFVLAGFGNSFSSDGPFLDYITAQQLAMGRQGMAVMINGGEAPAAYRARFIEVRQDEETTP